MAGAVLIRVVDSEFKTTGIALGSKMAIHRTFNVILYYKT
jgi:hypothetical protein